MIAPHCTGKVAGGSAQTGGQRLLLPPSPGACRRGTGILDPGGLDCRARQRGRGGRVPFVRVSESPAGRGRRLCPPLPSARAGWKGKSGVVRSWRSGWKGNPGVVRSRSRGRKGKTRVVRERRPLWKEKARLVRNGLLTTSGFPFQGRAPSRTTRRNPFRQSRQYRTSRQKAFRPQPQARTTRAFPFHQERRPA